MGATRCEECPSGTYSDNEGSTSCTICPINYCSEPGSSSCYECR